MLEAELTLEEFSDWLIKARPGDRLIYGTGSYLPARKPKVAEAVHRAYEAGQVLLVQKKIAPASYNYIAIRATTNLINNERMRAGK